MKYTIIVLGLVIASLNAFTQNSFINDSLDSYIQKGLKEWQVPGLALVIVKDGQVVVRKGYGVKDIETNEKVDENTLFMIASNTKLFTGMSLANLEYHKKISLNDKFIKYYPQFKLFDNFSTQQLTIRDLLTHRIGTKTFQGDFTFWNTSLSREQIMQKIQYLKPIGIFRQDYGYCNSCFLSAGMVIPKATNGISWEKFITDSFLQPLKMNNTYALSNNIASFTNRATPYTTSFTNKLQKVPYDQWDNLAPAASIVSNVKDLTNWLLFNIDSGKFEGKQIMPWTILQRTRDVQIITGSRKSTVYPINFRGYGLGVFALDYAGKQVYFHTGGAGGMVSNVCFVPEEKLGIAILTNNDNQNFFEALRYQILDSYLGVPFTNRSNFLLKFHNQEMEAQLKEIGEFKNATIGAKAKLPLERYIGNYSNKLYGKINIKAIENKLLVSFQHHPNLFATLTPMKGDDWLLEYNNIEFGIFKTKFTIANNQVKSVSIKANDFIEYDAYDFTKN